MSEHNFLETIPEKFLTFFEGPKSSRKLIKTLKAKAHRNRTTTEKMADWLTSKFGSMTFLVFNILVFAVWLVINSGFLHSVAPFDPFPFGLLTTFVSLEAIFLAVIVLISQNREQKVNDLREEIDLQVDIISEVELTKVLQLVALIAKKQGIDLSADKELEKMLRPLDVQRMHLSLEDEMK